MVLSPDESLNLRADIKATMGSLEARLRAGSNWSGAAVVARSLATKLDALAVIENRNDGPRHRVIDNEIPNDPVSQRAAARYAAKARAPRKPRIVVSEAHHEPPALGPGV